MFHKPPFWKGRPYLGLDLGSGQVQILFAACWKFKMVGTSTAVPAENKDERLPLVNHSVKTIHHPHHHY